MSARSIGKSSRLFSALFAVLIGSLPVMATAYWLLLPSDCLIQQWLDNRTVPHVLTMTKRLLGLGISFLDLIPLALSLIGFRQLFRHYTAGSFFGPENVRAFNTAGIGLIWFGVAQFLAVTLVGLAFTYDNPPGQRLIQIAVNLNAAQPFLFGAIIRLIGWVMDEARLLAEEQAQTV